MPSFPSTKAPSDVNFEVMRTSGAAHQKEDAKEERTDKAYRWKLARRAQSKLAAKAKAPRGPAVEAEKARKHNEGAWHTAKAQALVRNRVNETELKNLAELQSTTTSRQLKDYYGQQSQEHFDDLANRNNRLVGTMSLLRNISSEDADMMRPVVSRAKGAILPPPHPKSLASKAKHSPKAKRDAWRSKAAGSAPKTVETDLHASDRMNKTWNKVKAVVPGELPDLD